MPDNGKSLVSLFTTDDYPVDAIRAGEEGTTKVRLMINAEGRVDQCDVLISSESQVLDRATCDILQRRARFKPALDHQGRPTTDDFTQKVRWELPILEFEDRYGRVALALDPASAGSACSFEARVNLEETCDSPGLQTAKREILAMLSSPPHTGVLVVEMGQRVGKGEFLLQAGTGPGVQRLTLNAVTLTLGANGLVRGCTAAHPGHDAADVQAECDGNKGRKYEPLQVKDDKEQLRYITVYQLSYLRN